MVRISVLADCLKTMSNAEKRGKRQVLIRPSSKVIVKFLQQMQKNGELRGRVVPSTRSPPFQSPLKSILLSGGTVLPVPFRFAPSHGAYACSLCMNQLRSSMLRGRDAIDSYNFFPRNIDRSRLHSRVEVTLPSIVAPNGHVHLPPPKNTTLLI